jgi:hypothetical protein
MPAPRQFSLTPYTLGLLAIAFVFCLSGEWNPARGECGDYLEHRTQGSSLTDPFSPGRDLPNPSHGCRNGNCRGVPAIPQPTSPLTWRIDVRHAMGAPIAVCKPLESAREAWAHIPVDFLPSVGLDVLFRPPISKSI